MYCCSPETGYALPDYPRGTEIYKSTIKLIVLLSNEYLY